MSILANTMLSFKSFCKIDFNGFQRELSPFGRRRQKFMSLRLKCTFAALFAVMLALNMLYPTMSDDYLFRFVWHSETGSMYSLPLDAPAKRIENMGEIISSLKLMYLHWGGRMLTWGLVYVFANIPDIAFDFLNTLIFLVFITLITILGTHTFTLKQLNPQRLLLSFVLLWAASSMFANVYLWLCGSAVYLWAATAQLAFLFFFVRHFWQARESNCPSSLLMFLMGIVAGWSNENSAAVTIMLAAVLTYFFMREGRAEKWQTWGIVGALLGYAALMLAPGNFAKFSMTAASPETAAILSYQRQNALLAIVFCLPLLLIFSRLTHLSKTPLNQKVRQIAVLFFFAGVLNAVVMLPLPNFPLRSLTATVYFWLIGALTVLSAENSFFRQKPMRLLVRCYLLLSVISLFAFMYAMGAYLLPQDVQRDIMASQSTGQDLIIPPYHGPSVLINLAVLKGYRMDVGTIAQKKHIWPNVIYAKYWHLKSVMRQENFVAD